MKTLRAIIYLLLFVTGAVVLVWFLYGYINSLLVADPSVPAGDPPALSAEQKAESATTSSSATATSDQPAEQSLVTSVSSTSPDADTLPSDITQVSIATPSEMSNSYFQALGTVQSTGLATLSPLTSGSVKSVNFREGDYVKAGSVLVELTGSNLSEHQSLTQLRVAETNLANAKNSFANLQQTSEQTIKTAALQLQSARNQTAALAYDLGVIEQNRSGLDDALSIIYDSLSAAESKNSRDEIKGMRDIDDLIFTLNDAQDSRSRTQRQLEDLRDRLNELKEQQYSAAATADSQSAITSQTSPAVAESVSTAATAGLSQEIAAAEAQLGQLQAALDAQDKGIEELYGAIDKAKYGLNTTQDAAALTVNQLLGQIAQSESQANVLDLTLQSTRTKLGYDDAAGGSSDALRLAEQAYQSTRVQLQTALDSAATGVKLAELNLELARSQAAALQVRAPFDGVITSLPYSAGQNVGPQQAVAEILDPRSFELEVGVDISTAERISASAPALIELGGRQIEVPIKSIGLKVDDKTRQVKLRLALPNIFFKLNQTLKVRLPLATGATPTGNAGVPTTGATTPRFIPLDAVIIGTENQFVFVDDNGRAKKTDVKIGQIVGDRIEILSGLPADARVIVSGARKLVDGQPISAAGAQ
jgi:RND family efflux transporter MFP subunit